MYKEARRAAWTEIDLEDVIFNYNALRKAAPESEVIACIKADAYGHGAARIGVELVKNGAEMLGVATLDEAAQLRDSGISVPIVILGASPRENFKDVIELNVIPVITTIFDADLLSEAISKFSGDENRHDILIALETGMGRLGFVHSDESISEIMSILELPGINIKGLFSHLSTADEKDQSYTKNQIMKFNAFADDLKAAGLPTDYKTLSNSAGTISYPEAH